MIGPRTEHAVSDVQIIAQVVNRFFPFLRATVQLVAQQLHKSSNEKGSVPGIFPSMMEKGWRTDPRFARLFQTPT